MAAAGRILTGFSKPYVALYAYDSTDGFDYSACQLLARGVSVTASPETSDDNNFYADNVIAETEAGTFTGGTLNLTVDGLLAAAESMIMGLSAADTAGFVNYDDTSSIPDVGLGFVMRYQSDGDVTYVPVVFPRVAFDLIEMSAETQEDTIDWQTQDLTAHIKRAEDANRTWKKIGGGETTEAAAAAKITTFFGVTS